MATYLQEHLQLAHDLWKKLLDSSDNAIDATCGNGKDSLFLASTLSTGLMFCYDIQKKAIENTHKLLKEHAVDLNKITFINSSHETFSEIPNCVPIKLITYNLGYLPGSDKSITTMKESTVNSIHKGLNLIVEGGALSITTYSGHLEGEKEQLEIFSLLDHLDKTQFVISVYQWPKAKAPCLIWIKKTK